jgi:hypothetical protein
LSVQLVPRGPNILIKLNANMTATTGSRRIMQLNVVLMNARPHCRIKQPNLPVATHHLLRILVQEVELVRCASLRKRRTTLSTTAALGGARLAA